MLHSHYPSALSIKCFQVSKTFLMVPSCKLTHPLKKKTILSRWFSYFPKVGYVSSFRKDGILRIKKHQPKTRFSLQLTKSTPRSEKQDQKVFNKRSCWHPNLSEFWSPKSLPVLLYRYPSREWIPTKREKEIHLYYCLWMGYVSFRDGRFLFLKACHEGQAPVGFCWSKFWTQKGNNGI